MDFALLCNTSLGQDATNPSCQSHRFILGIFGGIEAVVTILRLRCLVSDFQPDSHDLILCSKIGFEFFIVFPNDHSGERGRFVQFDLTGDFFHEIVKEPGDLNTVI